ncbi:uncharacterized protein LOC121049277 [Rosa chinensis]|uniref:uncharacterized protein LOC121049277 n=1 Tax=Rosa chinensis TaxID=74649 RepID=UPI001AD8F0E7|nr:uncharacterized protein LOC121049277 [Rosa chinensis]
MISNVREASITIKNHCYLTRNLYKTSSVEIQKRRRQISLPSFRKRKLSHKIWSWNHFFQACLHDLELENGIGVLNKATRIRGLSLCFRPAEAAFYHGLDMIILLWMIRLLHIMRFNIAPDLMNQAKDYLNITMFVILLARYILNENLSYLPQRR